MKYDSITNPNNYSNDSTNTKIEEELNKIKCRECKDFKPKEKINLDDSPLLKLCSCPDYIHYKCLKDIINKKEKVLITKNSKNNVIKYEYQKFFCQKCNTQYPLRFRISENIYELYELIDLDINPQEVDYIILESLNNITDKTKILYLVIFNGEDANNEIYIGRIKENNGIKNDFIINEDKKDKDKTVSRIHAVLKKDKNGNIIIEDKNSTFGTSVLIKGNNIKLREEKIYFQIGRSYISARLIDKK